MKLKGRPYGGCDGRNGRLVAGLDDGHGPSRPS